MMIDDRARPERLRRRDRHGGEDEPEIFLSRGGQHNQLKRLNSAKEIKAFSFDRFWSGLAGFCWIWLHLGSAWKNH
jgi:hypothetical protein